MAKYVHDGRADGLRVFGFGVGATLFGRACGSLFGSVLAGLWALGAVSFSSVSLVMVVFLVLVCVAVLPERSLERLVKESASATGEGTPVEAGGPASALSSGLTEERLARCRELARAHALTPREAEVMVLLVRGRNAQVVARELSIAVGTVQAHTKHVYGKLGVHNQQELIDLVEDGGVQG